MNANGATMAAGSFMTVSATDGACTLADFTVSGYTAPTWDSGEGDYINGCPAGRFVIQFLTSSGSVDSMYTWIDNGELGPGWFNTDKTAIDGGPASIKISAGQAMWIQGRGMKLTSAGAVSKDDIAFVTHTSGASAIVNGTPIDQTLARLTVTGYTAPSWDKGEGDYVNGCPAGRFVVQFLTTSGTVESMYTWIDNGELGPGWFNTDKTTIEGGATSVSIPAGKGLWVQGRGMTLQIPAPEL